jgi:hypothetical protein
MAVDLGDAEPRSAVLIRYATPAGQDSFMSTKIRVPTGTNSYYTAYVEYVEVLPISGDHGANDTGVSLGGFGISDTHYLIAGTTVDQGEGYDPFGQRNIFITATDKENFSSAGTTIHYITNWTAADDCTVTNPYLIPLEGGSFLLIWTETAGSGEMLKYCRIDGTGKPVDGTIYSTPGSLSDCEPVVHNGKLVWYVTSASPLPSSPLIWQT